VGAVRSAEIVPPKAGRTGGSPTTVFRLTRKALLPAPASGLARPTAQFVAPKAKKSGSSGGSTTAQFVAPKAKKAKAEVIAKVGTPAKPLLLAPATTSTTAIVDQAAPSPKPATEATPVDIATPDAGMFHAMPREVELAYLSAAQRYGYGAYAAASYSEHEDEGSYDNSSYYEVTSARGTATRGAGNL
jgi:hypothetical protein